MVFGVVLGQERALRLLRRDLETGRIAHAYLFSGPEGVGKRTTAEFFACSILCLAPRERPCGECRSCRLFRMGNHPNYYFLAPEQGGSLGIALVKELLSKVYRSASGYRVAVIDQAESLTLEAQNAMLKLLEEPPRLVCFLLVTSQKEALLPTVVSRCREVKFGRLPRSVVAACLKERGFPPEEAACLASLSGGSLGKALTLSEERVKIWRERALELLVAPRLRTLLSWEEVKDKDLALTVLDFFTLWVRDFLVFQLTREPKLLLNGDREEKFWEETDLPLDYLLVAGDLADKARQWLRFNVRPAVCLEGLVVGLARKRGE
ncbi:DNA polymerase III, delta prime subunit [Ammonifex degensii KC4]|uniref:DNA polymerase III, delta prime subunit n=1 Tax=Ammonifex degensii (strain DSM 10501 / KC4) TaxID=429009 RepID=C9RA67_AMMDK|nr:DNA polymerase III subunit delta' [Ammonifex degensii]ACX53196.1 DNA polymerase III, delta prime subunit [Ammonifex degensii KC4]